MPSGLSRIGDIGVGTCCGHSSPTCIPMTGTISTGSGNVLIEGIGGAGVGDIVIGGCGHVGIIVSGSPKAIINGKGAAQIGSSFVGIFYGIIITGAGTVTG